MAQELAADKRLDYLGRSSLQVLYDVGMTVEWPLGANNHTDLLGRAGLHQALGRRDESTVLKFFFDHKAGFRQLCMSQLSAMHIAACQGHTQMVMFLIERLQSLVDMPDGLGRSPSWYAAENSRLDIMDLLGLRRDVNIDRKDTQLPLAMVATPFLDIFPDCARQGLKIRTVVPLLREISTIIHCF